MKKKTYTYAELHNKTLLNYRKVLSSFIFVAILNVLGIIMNVIRVDNGYFPSLISNVLIFNFLSQVISSRALFIFLSLLISFVFSAVFILIWLFAKNGNFKVLITGIILYVADTTILFVFYLGERYLLPQLALHIIILIFLILSLVNYYHLLAIERKFHR